MEIVFVGVAIFQSIGVALGVGASTLAIISFFVAIADGQINSDERRLLGVVYIVLRVAMVVILLATCLLTLMGYYNFALSGVAPYGVAFFVLIAVLYGNAILMTLHKMPSTLGPALQASTWYTLGVLNALLPLGLVAFTLLEFLLAYLAVIAITTTVVNVHLAQIKARQQVSRKSN